MRISKAIACSTLSPLDAEVLLSYVLRKSREWLFAHSEEEISGKNIANFKELSDQRRSGISVAALTGKKEFFGLEFYVNADVLVPRPGTEILVEEVLDLKPLSLLDVGTGSGCIAIAVKKNLAGCEVSACDISERALGVARKNAKKHEVEVDFFESDLLEEIPPQSPLYERGEAKRNETGGFDVIVANLPYIPEASKEVEAGVEKFEPGQALFAGADGLDFIKRLLIQVSELITKPKYILLEFGGEGQVGKLKNLTKKLFPSAKVRFRRDLAGLPRVCKISLKLEQ